MTPSLEGWPTKAKEASSPHEVRLALLDTNPVLMSEDKHLILVLLRKANLGFALQIWLCATRTLFTVQA